MQKKNVKHMECINFLGKEDEISSLGFDDILFRLWDLFYRGWIHRTDYQFHVVKSSFYH